MFRWKKRPASEGGGFLVTQLDYAARKQDEQRAAAAAAAPSRPGLTAPDEWSRTHAKKLEGLTGSYSG